MGEQIAAFSDIQDREKPALAIVVPCFNESEVLERTAEVLAEKVRVLVGSGSISEKSRILFVDDGSRDDTWEKIVRLVSEEPESTVFSGIKFAHNRGHQNAVYAGLMEAYASGYDCAVSMDADLQDDPNAIDEMLREYKTGAEIVYGVRNNRDTDTAFKRGTAHAFYGLMSALGTHTIPDHADFRLMGRCALAALGEYEESNLFLRGIVPDLGFTTAKVYYKRAERQAGQSKYPLGKMIGFALEGITSFSVKPIRLIMVLGGVSFVLAVAALIYTLVSLAQGHAVAGWASIMASIWLLGSAFLVSLGIIGEYIGKIYVEVKNRPRYIVEKRVGME
ncbi:glycosyltransferase [Alloscardovia macacae]|uniref:Glycosyltransferase n=1 Tax=Alloscardovia macacae TaxID=1160091 RepID=A0A1Y2SSS9_9BIFI|nr:glycosyltransferase family 2 protein [Alloscardovia macacae]OTA25678.1 glycosyltransferase [Alloscardovia macacae]OTA29607.1 glycosyltransferase [Alloscardovia macacae]